MYACPTSVKLISDSCCEVAYVPNWGDCTEHCLDGLITTEKAKTIDLWGNAVALGHDASKHMGFLLDMAMLRDLLLTIRMQQTALTEAGAPSTFQAIWDDNQLQCVVTYFQCSYALNIGPMLTAAGLPNPAGVIPGLPPFSALDCGVTPTDPVDPPVWPPICFTEEQLGITQPVLTILDPTTIRISDPWAVLPQHEGFTALVEVYVEDAPLPDPVCPGTWQTYFVSDSLTHTYQFQVDIDDLSMVPPVDTITLTGFLDGVPTVLYSGPASVGLFVSPPFNYEDYDTFGYTVIYEGGQCVVVGLTNNVTTIYPPCSAGVPFGYYAKYISMDAGWTSFTLRTSSGTVSIGGTTFGTGSPTTDIIITPTDLGVDPGDPWSGCLTITYGDAITKFVDNAESSAIYFIPNGVKTTLDMSHSPMFLTTDINMSASTGLEIMKVGGPWVRNVTMPSGAPLGIVEVKDSNLSIASANNIVNACDSTIAGGTCDISGGTSAAPDSGSSTNMAACQSNGWTFITN